MTYIPSKDAVLAIQNIASNTTLTNYNILGLVDASGGAVTVTLAAAAGNVGEEVEIIKTDSSASAVTILPPAGATINGLSSITLTGEREGVSLRVASTTALVASDDVKVDIRAGIKKLTASATLTSADEVVEVDASGGAVVVTLPAMSAVASGTKTKNFYIKKIDGSANAVTVARTGTDTIEDPDAANTPAASISFNTQGVSYNFAASSTLDVWRII